MTQKSIIITAIIAIVVAAVAFFGGMKYQQSQTTSQSSQLAQGIGRYGAGRFGGRGGMATVGKIVATDATSITIQLADGSSKIINVSSSTRIVKSNTASASDLTNGIDVAIFGITNSDGSIAAQNIQINPAQGMLRLARPSTQPTQ